MIYLDRVTTTPTDPRVLDAMLPFLREAWGSPRSRGSMGDPAAAALDEARKHVAALVGSDAENVHFTSGGTEACAWAIQGFLRHPKVRASGKPRVVAAPVESLAVLRPLERAASDGLAEIASLPVDSHGRVSPDDVRRALKAGNVTLLVVQAANAEIGTLQPLAELGEAAREAGVPLFVDATSAAGWIPLDTRAMNISYLALSAHYFHGPKGSGALVRMNDLSAVGLRKAGAPLVPLFDGGADEGGLRAGTPNVAGIAGFSRAAQLAAEEMESRAAKLRSLEKELRGALAGIDGLAFTGHPTNRLPGHVSLVLDGADGEALLVLLDKEGVAASSGSACVSEAGKPSHVLLACGFSKEKAKGSLVLAPLPDASAEEMRRAGSLVKECIARLRRVGGGA